MYKAKAIWGILDTLKATDFQYYNQNPSYNLGPKTETSKVLNWSPFIDLMPDNRRSDINLDSADTDLSLQSVSNLKTSP